MSYWTCFGQELIQHKKMDKEMIGEANIEQVDG